MNNKILFIILAALGVLYLATKIFNPKTERTFKREVVIVDTSAINAIELNPKVEQHQLIRLERQPSGAWQVSKGDITAPADKTAVTALIGTLGQIRAKRVAAKKKEKWKEFEVDEENGSIVKVFAGDKLQSELVVGRFSFDQTTKTATSFVRLAESPEVYAVDGFLSLSFNQPFSTYRVKTIVDVQNGNISRLTYDNPEDSFVISRSPTGQWLLNESVPLDSTKVAQYINGLRKLSGTEFAENFHPNTTAATYSLDISGDNMSPVSISAYKTEDSSKPFVIKSNLNDAYFLSDSSGIWNKLFSPPTTLEN